MKSIPYLFVLAAAAIIARASGSQLIECVKFGQESIEIERLSDIEDVKNRAPCSSLYLGPIQLTWGPNGDYYATAPAIIDTFLASRLDGEVKFTHETDPSCTYYTACTTKNLIQVGERTYPARKANNKRPTSHSAEL